MAALCRAGVVVCSSSYQHACCTSSNSGTCSVASASPCLRTNGSSVSAEPHVGALSLCNRGKGFSRRRGSRLRAEPQLIFLSGGEVQGEEELLNEDDETDGSEPLPQLIVPNIDQDLQTLVPSTDDHPQIFGLSMDDQFSDEALLEVVDAELDELDTHAEREEDAPDFWLAEFQRHLPREAREEWNQVSDYSGLPRHVSRRRALGAPMFMSLMLAFGWAVPAKPARAFAPASIDLSRMPKSSQFDAKDSRLRDAVSTFRQALDASTVEEEERLWTEVIDAYGGVDAAWVPDILARALGNRGNARSRQGQLELALADYNRSIELAPYAVDPVLNRGVALESLGRLEEASSDYEAVLHVQPEDPAAWNNLGNVKAALSQWNEALVNYSRAVQLAPKFSFAAANYALALYQVGRDNEAVRQFRNLLRRYPEFADVRAALAISLYDQGLYGEAETNWNRLEDGRYADREWVQNTRRWPPRLAVALGNFLDVKRAES